METMDRLELAQRTRERNALTWLTLDFGGIMAPLTGMEADLDSIAMPSIENYLIISDEAWGIKESQRDKTIEMSQAEIDQDVLLAEAKAATGRAKIAIERAADEYTLAAKTYDSMVRGLIMGAKEFAALVEREMLLVDESKAALDLEKESLRQEKLKAEIIMEAVAQGQAVAELARAELAVDKEALRRDKIGAEIVEQNVQQGQAGVDLAKMDLAVDKEGVHLEKVKSEVYLETVKQTETAADLAKSEFAVDKEGVSLEKVNSMVYLEYIQQKQVEADLAKSQVDVAKAHIRAVMSGIDAGKAEVEVIEAQVQTFMAEAEKATLQADVAMVYAEILTKKLSEVQLDMGSAEIAAGYKYIQSKLTDTLAMYDIRILGEKIKEDAEILIKAEIDTLLTSEKAEQELRNLEADYARLTFDHEQDATLANIAQEQAMRAALVTARERLNDARLAQSVARDAKHTWAQKLINVAEKYTHKHGESATTAFDTEYDFISG